MGLSVALALAQYGADVRLIDKLAAPTDRSRAAIIYARTLELFERLGFVEDFLAAGIRVHGAAVYAPNALLLTRPNLDHLSTAYPFMLGLEQFETERLLTARLAALGVAVERGTELLDLSQAESGVRVRSRTAGGCETTEEFSYVVGADGARSAVRTALGLHLEGETLDATWITADVKIRWDRSPDEAIAFLSTEGFAFIAPMNDNRWRVIVNAPKMTPEAGAAITMEDIQTLVRERFGLDAPLYDPVWISPFSINTRLAPTMRIGRVFLAGDASHVHSPVGGQGMNTGIQDALNLAWKLALVLQGRAREELLASYDAERHANAKRLLHSIGPATKLVNLRHPVSVEIRNLAIRVVSQLGLTANIARNFSMLEVAYPDSPAVEDHRPRWRDCGPRAGERAPDAGGMLEANGVAKRLFETWRGDPRLQLLIFAGPGATAARSAELRLMAEEFKDRRDLVHAVWIPPSGDPADGLLIDSESHAYTAYDVSDEACYLVRPDGYIGFRSSPVDCGALRAYLQRWHPAGTHS